MKICMKVSSYQVLAMISLKENSLFW